MIDVYLKGILAKKFWGHSKFNVSSVYEIFKALEANYNNFTDFFRKIEKISTHYIVFINGKLMPIHFLNSNILKNGDKVEIVPVVQGGCFTVLLIIAIVLIAVGFLLMKLLTPKEPKDIKTSSSVLGSTRNVTNRNIPIPIGYGRLRVGSIVVSNYVDIYHKNASSSKAKNPKFKSDPDDSDS